MRPLREGTVTRRQAHSIPRSSWGKVQLSTKGPVDLVRIDGGKELQDIRDEVMLLPKMLAGIVEMSASFDTVNTGEPLPSCQESTLNALL
jgi:hypothetical protein